ncbi:MAG: alpha/beta hydrolase [Balneolaceae bacterium]|nr:MAG: alpha/beta hydrolase [Balneolaceae bacterium]
MPLTRSSVTGSTVLWILMLVAGGYLIILLLMYLFQSAFIYFPTKNLTATPEDRGLEYEEVYLYTEDDLRLHGWYIPAPEARGSVLFFHGNAGNISGRLESIMIFNELRLNVMIFDYRGYGRSEGKPTEEGTYRDAIAAWRYLTEVQDENPRDIILFGRSLGGGVAAWLASEVEAGGLVLESTFTSAADLASEIYPFIPVRWLLRIRYPVIDYIDEIRKPVMIAHSRNDEVIPYHHGQKLYEAASEPKYRLELQGGHNDGFILTGRHYLDGWDHFLTEVLE